MLERLIGSALLLPTVCLCTPWRGVTRKEEGGGGAGRKETPRALTHRAALDLQTDLPLQWHPVRRQLCGRRLLTVLTPRATAHTCRNAKDSATNCTSIPPALALHAALSLHSRKPARRTHAQLRAKTLRTYESHQEGGPHFLLVSRMMRPGTVGHSQFCQLLAANLLERHEHESIEGGAPLTSLSWRASFSPAQTPGIMHDAPTANLKAFSATFLHTARARERTKGVFP